MQIMRRLIIDACTSNDSVLSSPETGVMSTTRPPPPEIPKSPPKWPLRPGVLVHVKCDTKQNLCANRIQSPNASSSTAANLNLTNVSYASPLINMSSRNTSVNGSVISAANTTSKVPELPARNATPPIIIAVAPKSAAVKATMSVEIATVRPTTCGSSINASGIDSPTKTATVKRLQSASIPNACNTQNDTIAINSGVGTPAINENTIDSGQNIGVGDIDSNDVETRLMMGAPSTINNANNNDELMNFTTSSLIERILGRLRWRREHNKHSNQNNSNSKKSMGIATVPHNQQQSATQTNVTNGGDNAESIFSRSNKRAVNLLRATGWFGSGKSTNSSTGLMCDKRHHLSGITCSDGGKYMMIIRIGFHDGIHDTNIQCDNNNQYMHLYDQCNNKFYRNGDAFE